MSTRKVTTAAGADHSAERTKIDAFFSKSNVWEIKRVTATELSLLVAKAFDLDDKKTLKQRRPTLALLPYHNRVVKPVHHNHDPDRRTTLVEMDARFGAHASTLSYTSPLVFLVPGTASSLLCVSPNSYDHQLFPTRLLSARSYRLRHPARTPISYPLFDSFRLVLRAQ